MLSEFQDFITNSDFAKGGLLFMFGGSLLGILYKSIGVIRSLLARLFFVNIKVISNQETFWYMHHWLEQTSYTKKYCSNLMVNKYVDEELYSPSYGRHVLFHNKRLHILNYYVEQDKQQRTENIDLSIFSLFRKRELAKKVIEEGKKLIKNREYKGTNIYVANYDYWKKHTLRKGCYTPILGDEKAYDNIINDLKGFEQSENWYLDNGINYKRNYLFYGAPGNGKTTCILSLAQYFKKDLYILNLSSGGVSERNFLELISSVPDNGLLCIEDIDAANNNVKQREGLPPLDLDQPLKLRYSGDDDDEAVSLSTMLNVLDGLYTPHGLRVFITTNYIEKLDSALIRKGRIDYKHEFKNANEFQLSRLFQSYFPRQNPEKFIEWGKGKSMSEVHGKLIENKESISENL